MAKTFQKLCPYLLLIFSFFVSNLFVANSHEFSVTLSKRAAGLRREKLSHLHFFFHDTVTGKNPTAVTIARAATTNESHTEFGLMAVMDDPLTAGPNLSSKLVGRAQGIYASAAMDDVCLLMVVNFAFVDGKYNGSGLSVVGRNEVFSGVRELPIVGGSGVFRFARGYAQAKTHALDLKTGNAVVEYNVYVFHYYLRYCAVLEEAGKWFGGVINSQEFARKLSKKAMGLKTEKLSHLRFFFHDIVSGKNPTAVKIAQAAATNKSATGFGMMAMMDDPLTAGPDVSSKLVGRAQGIYASAAIDEIGLLMVLNFAFVEGKYNGSSLSVVGRNTVVSAVREMPVVGGSGLFRFARGYAQAKTHTYDPKTGDAVVEYNVYVFHY
nr:dirigent protein 22-like [Ipomoea batatas]GMD85693.1 dirigent protein 22-like [Ipomoea batatas]